MMALSLCNSLLVSFVVLSIFVGGCSGTGYVVGNFWEEPSDLEYYTKWSSSHEFYVGDKIVFSFDNDHYNVIQVPFLDYENCSARSPYAVFNHEPAIFPLKEAGVFYFVCNISNYCQLGQRVSITVNALPPPPPSPPLPPPESSPLPSPSTYSIPPKTSPSQSPTSTLPTPALSPSRPLPSPSPFSSPQQKPKPPKHSPIPPQSSRSLPPPTKQTPTPPKPSPTPPLPPIPREYSPSPKPSSIPRESSPEPPASNSQSPGHARGTECGGLIGLLALCLMMFL